MKFFLCTCMFASFFFLHASDSFKLIDSFKMNTDSASDKFSKKTVILPDNTKVLKEIVFVYEDTKKQKKEERFVIDKRIENRSIIIADSEVIEKMPSLYSPIIEASLDTSPKLSYKNSINYEKKDLSFENIDKVKINKYFSFLVIENNTIAVFSDLNIINLENDNYEKKNTITSDKKIILDFKTEKSKELSKKIDINNSGFKNVKFGSHNGFFRIVIFVEDNHDLFMIKKLEKGYLIKIYEKEN